MNKSANTDSNDHETLKRLNNWLIGIGIFILTYTIILLLFLEHRTDEIQHDRTTSIVSIDPVSGNVIANYSNVPSILPPVSDTDTNTFPKLYIEKQSYELQEAVIVRYFNQLGIVLDKKPGNIYTIIYRDNDHRLQTIDLPHHMLAVPTLNKQLVPFSLMNH